MMIIIILDHLCNHNIHHVHTKIRFGFVGGCGELPGPYEYLSSPPLPSIVTVR